MSPSTFVATESTVVLGEDGQTEELKAGQTFVHNARHYLVTRYPSLWRRVSAPDRQAAGRRPAARPRLAPARAVAATPPAPPAAHRPLVILNQSAPATFTIKLSEKARDLIRDEAWRSRDGDEIGGALYGEPAGLGDTGLTIKRASGPGPRSTRSAARFTIDSAAFQAGENGPVRWCGDWHTHPGSALGIPSDGDLKGWVRTLEAYGTDRYLGLIVTAPRWDSVWGEDARPDWNEPAVHGWVLTHAYERYTCQPAHVEGW
jgi:hypothetical protein